MVSSIPSVLACFFLIVRVEHKLVGWQTHAQESAFQPIDGDKESRQIFVVMFKVVVATLHLNMDSSLKTAPSRGGQPN